MSFTRAKPLGWAFGEILTSAQMNALDTDHANAIDKTGDSITGALTFSNFTLASGSKVKLGGTQTFTRTQPAGNAIPDSGTNWAYVANPGCWEAQVNSAHPLSWQINPPDGCILGDVDIWLRGSASDVGLPATMPTFSGYIIDTTGTTTLLGTGTDTSVDVTAYKALHKMTVTFNQVVDRTKLRYQLTVMSEAGAGANAAMRVFGVNAKFQVGSGGMDPAGA